MANEWGKVELYGANNDGDPRRYTIADGASVSKGDLLQVADNREASHTIATFGPVAGVALEEHIPNVRSTSISCWTNGVFSALASATITAGDYLAAGGLNAVTASAAALADAVTTMKSNGSIRALDGATDAILNVRLNC